VVPFALWTVAFNVALLAGVGWGLAAPLWLGGLIATAVFAVRAGWVAEVLASGRAAPIAGRGSLPAWVVTAVMAAVTLVPVIGGGKQAASVVVAAVAVGAVFAALRQRDGGRVTADWRLVAVLAVAGLLALCLIVTWNLFIVATAAVVVLAVVLVWRDGIAPGRADLSARTKTTVGDDHDHENERWTLTLPVLLNGLLLSAYILTTREANFDNGYYMRKAQAYGQEPWDFSIRDYLFDIPGVDHIPRGTIFSSYEPMAGLIGRVTGAHHITVMSILVAPLMAFLLPLAFSWMAKAFGAARPDVAGCVASLVVFVLPGTHDFRMFIRFVEGKAPVALYLVPLFAAAVIVAVQRPSRRNLVFATAMALTAFGMSPTAGFGLMPAGATALFAATIAFGVRPGTRQFMVGAIPVGVAIVVNGLAYVAHRSIPHGADRFPSGYQSWITRLVGRDRDVSIEGQEWKVVVLLACLGFVILAGRRPVQRLYFGTILAGLVLVIYNPLLFKPVFGELGLNGLSWRAGWALPFALAVGLTVDTLVQRRAGRLPALAALAVVVAVAGLGGSPFSRTDQGRPAWDWTAAQVDAAQAVLAATPPGTRYLAPDTVEVVATAVSNERYAVAVRVYFVTNLKTYDDLPNAFRVGARERLSRGIRGERSTQEAALADLARLNVGSVCMTAATHDELRQAVQLSYTNVERLGLCNLWVRNDLLVAPAE
jgi:hypothetical protein